MNWNLDTLYLSFDDPKYQKDFEKLTKIIENYNQLPNLIETEKELTVILKYLALKQELTKISRSLFSFNSLTRATDVSNQTAIINLAKLTNLLNKTTKTNVLMTRFLKDIDLEPFKSHPEIADNFFHLTKIKESAQYLLSEQEEILYSKLRELSSVSWSRIQTLLTAKLDVNYQGKTVTLPEVRNLAYDASKKVRKAAYDAELKAYESVEEVVAIALSNIKREVNIMNELRGYDSVLEQTLIRSNLKKETLEAMLATMMDYRVYFRDYLKAKAQYLGYQNGLPFYELFAPIGSLTKEYSYLEAQEIIIASFDSYSPKLANFAKKAFQNNWIDPFPKKGKSGGAFCSNQPQIKESRILTNFTGSLSDIATLAHELGHGYHGEIISENSALNWSYPMPLAETASIFCETIVTNHLLSEISDDNERLSVLEIAIQGDTQVIIDILSRYLFETDILALAEGPISNATMKELMIKAQKEAYLDGLDENILHPYMWLNKGHYYSSGLNFYNFPYAFGLLFGKGLYALYLKDKKAFLNNYDNLLALTTKASVEEVALAMNIDITKKEFWENSLKLIKKDLDEVIHLMKVLK
ncbi:MAG: M3 family oligoendopeptidase [Acholeplasmatales bacterium]|jgi:pepF/M3 family oligoendopeptidase|nr:M3 family oligoendopeptidase [Acholeplasmataceae bacterium]MDY0114958.1 M3 family oligoendopeptidase [Acholeplasmatales bacterium]MCK9233875.1 M3 family oligoendopeptidase [Acholeplasmataceae bacterium]MCK9289134.1 M3 family oligoendopeptidase [Acholeplasmataceae bacterium]MCK9427102.1 M3 family oligoendopeptidase [Acholeplasmataceae bacterium]